jgi:hypothetical protein
MAFDAERIALPGAVLVTSRRDELVDSRRKNGR